jgi:hypothetical protein
VKHPSGTLLALPTNIKLGLRDLKRANTLAFYKHS